MIYVISFMKRLLNKAYTYLKMDRLKVIQARIKIKIVHM